MRIVVSESCQSCGFEIENLAAYLRVPLDLMLVSGDVYLAGSKNSVFIEMDVEDAKYFYKVVR